MFRSIAIAGLCLCTLSATGQDTLSYAEQLRIIEEEMDSLSIFNLIDSLFNMESTPSSEMNIRLSYTTNVTSAGRDFNINQSGISPGVSYYHKSGLYGDLAGYWNSGAEPHYNPTILSLGYLGNFKHSKWSYTLDGEKWFYHPNDSSDNPLTYSVGGSLSYDFQLGFASVDYSFLFGDKTAHRIITNLTGTIRLGKWWLFQSISLYPSASMMAGNGDITQMRITNQQVNEERANRIERLTSFANLTDQQKQYLEFLIKRAHRNDRITLQTRIQLLNDLRISADLSEEDQASLQQIVNEGYTVEELVNSTGFGILNYAFTLPLSLSTNRLNIFLSYTYSIPVKLPGEEFIEIDPIGYFGVSISYRIPFK